jgi:hypothetical protein
MTQPTPLPPLNNTTPEQAFLIKNYDKNADAPTHPPRWPRRALRLVVILASDSRAHARGDAARSEDSGDARAHRRRPYSGAR